MEMTTYQTVFVEFLRKQGLKLTTSRSSVLEAAYRLREHFDADSLFESIRETDRHTSRATVYRTLVLLIESGLVRESVGYGDKKHYETVFGSPRHLHLVCTRCGRIIEEDVQPIADILKSCAEAHGFEPGEISVVVRGLCLACRQE